MAEKAEEMEKLSSVQTFPLPLSGGYDYEFIEEPTEDMKCSVCLSVLRDPHLTSCCGNHFCQSCITRIKGDGNPCPLCQERDFTTMLNKSVSRKIKDLTICCPNKSQGCEWTGVLRNIESHLDQENGCEYVVVECTQCNESFTRIALVNHHHQDCPYRPYACDYCGHKDTMKEITENHWPVCDEYPVCCPNECKNESLKRKDLDTHVQKNCPLQRVSCTFLFAGCGAEIVRQDLSVHMMEQQSVHLSLLATYFQQLAMEKIADLEQVVKDQQAVLVHKDTLLSDNKKRIIKLEETVKQHKEQIHELKLMLERQKNVPEAKYFPPVDLYMNDIWDHWHSEDQWFSEPFYSHPSGYKMCLSVYAYGTGKGRSNHISVFAHIMKGEYDDKLSWPFRGTVTVTLITDDEDDDFEGDLEFTSKSPAKATRRVDEGSVLNDYGQGVSKFVEWDDVSHLSCFHFRIGSVNCDLV